MIKNATFFEDYSLYLFFKYTGIYIIRHPGRDCRDPEAMDGNIKMDHKFCCGELHNSQPFTSLCSGFRQSLPE
jgi:hypothetical protein